jgi:hypothetical protein
MQPPRTTLPNARAMRLIHLALGIVTLATLGPGRFEQGDA